MALPDPLTSKAAEPGGVGRSLRCLVEKDGKRFMVYALRQQFDAKTDEVHFPAYLYEGDGFTLLAMEGEPDFESLSANVN